MAAISSEQFQQLITLVYVLIGLLGALAFVGVGGLIAFARGNKETLRLAFQSASPETQQLIRTLVKEINDAADLAVEVTTPGDTSGQTTTTTTTTLSAEPVTPQG
jgi:hypothetical protein